MISISEVMKMHPKVGRGDALQVTHLIESLWNSNWWSLSVIWNTNKGEIICSKMSGWFCLSLEEW